MWLKTWKRWRGAGAMLVAGGVMLAAGGLASPAVEAAAEETPLCFGLPATIVGTDPAGETLRGTPGDDVIVGLGGDDFIVGYDGNDRICGGAGRDTITAGPGNDRAHGGAGRDVIAGGPGRDLLRGGGGADNLRGDDGNDRLFGGGGNDRLDGGAGTDRLDGGAGTDTCFGETKAACELPVAVRDFSSGTVNLEVSGSKDAVSTISVPGSGTITDLNVGIEITHTYIGDLIIELTHVSTGTTVVLFDQPGTTVYTPPGLPCGSNCGCSGNDIDATLDDEASVAAENMCRSTAPAIYGSVRPNHLLSAFDGEDMGGTWRLTVYDVQTGDSGILVSWSLHFTV